ncbi:isochorismatase family cysteine hydrolase [Streptomyces sp. W16]|uniref:cysteine hydrolase family protein n=1 Tax=Streptomyces sp. W16 TaxID=3076631 RepID=UPI00295B2AFC|nr:isochorismatase family cysteine hydrolase [Streptomyces sp. W16]MDV9170867.1 isochorismatase family cysteine hydrolase [Streptomyces sp. W16]
MSRPALLVLDMVNELVHPEGHYAHVCRKQVEARGVIDRTAVAIERARAANTPVIFVVLGYGHHYEDWAGDSPLFGPPDPEHRFVLGRWGTHVHERLAPESGEDVVVKQRVSPFYGTNLELLLRSRKIDSLLLTGVATDLVVLMTAREAHDRDFAVTVLEDATATGDEALQDAAVLMLARTAVVSSVDQALPRAR